MCPIPSRSLVLLRLDTRHPTSGEGAAEGSV